MLLFIASLLMLSGLSSLLAYYFGRTAGERFHFWLATSALQIGVISQTLSLFHQLRPLPWITLQMLLTTGAGLFILFRHRTESSIRKQNVLSGSSRRKSGQSLNAVVFIQWVVIAMFVLSSAARQLVSPIIGFDERMYHASRVLYWIQNQSIFPYTTHNDRQVFLTSGSEFWFLWPVLLTREEIVGRMVFWLGFPLLIFSLYFLLRELRIRQTHQAICLMLIVSAPLLGSAAVGLKPEIWTAVFITGTGYWLVRALIAPEGRWKSFFLCGIFCALSANSKLTALTLLPLVLLLPLVTASNRRLSGSVAGLTGLLMGILLCGILVPTSFNLYRYGNLSGSPQFRKVLSSDLNFRQLYTHCTRLPFLMLEPPLMPAAGVRDLLTQAGNKVIAISGAAQILPLESSTGWPGAYSYAVPARAEKFSSGGILWLMMTAGGLIYLTKKFFRSQFRLRLNLVSALMLLQAAAFFGIVLLTRWMVHSQVPQRFLVSVYPLGLTVSVMFLKPLLFRRLWLTGFLVLITLCTMLSTLRTEAGLLRMALLWGSPEAQRQQASEPFTEVLQHLPAGASILLVGSQDIRDYPLFAPQSRYANRVMSWGKQPFDAARMQQYLNNNQISHILVQNDQELSFHWDPPISTREMVNWLSEQNEIPEIPLSTPGMRLFSVPVHRKN